jgi:hypothetical protein
MRTLTSLLCASALVLGATACSDEESPDQAVPSSTEVTGATTTTMSEEQVWPGPVRDPSDVVHRVVADDQGGGSWDDPLDASERWADVARLDFSRTNYGHWNFHLEANPPPLEDLEPEVVLAYGLVFDTNADGAADYVVGLDNDAPRQGDFRAWLTDLRTGESNEQVGPPYGSPIEFGGWDAARANEEDFVAEPGAVEPPPTGDLHQVILTVLNGAQPADLDLNTMRFYAWTSAARDGLVFAHDYAPDTGWLSVD